MMTGTITIFEATMSTTLPIAMPLKDTRFMSALLNDLRPTGRMFISKSVCWGSGRFRFNCQTAQRRDMTAEKTRLIMPAAPYVPEFCDGVVPPTEEGAGNTGCWPHPRALRAKRMHIGARKKRQGSRNNRRSLRNGFTAYT